MQQTNEGNQEDKQQNGKARAIPPIVLRNKEKYVDISQAAARNGINIIKAKTIVDGVSLSPQTEEDFRHLIRFLEAKHC